MSNKPLEIFISGSMYKQVNMLLSDSQDFAFRNNVSLNCDSSNPRYDFVLATKEQTQEHCRPVLDYIIRSKVEQYIRLKQKIKPLDINTPYYDSLNPEDIYKNTGLYLLPTFCISSYHLNQALVERVSTLWEDLPPSVHYNDNRVVIQCEGSANGWSQVCAPRELAEDVIIQGFSGDKDYLLSVFGDSISVSTPRPDLNKGTFFTSGVIVRPHLTSILAEYRIIFSKDENGKLETAIMRKRKRTDIGGKYFQANMYSDNAVKKEIQVSRPDEIIEVHPDGTPVKQKHPLQDNKQKPGEFNMSMIEEMKYQPIDIGHIYNAVVELMDVIPHWFGAIDLAITKTGHVVVFEFSPEFGTKYTDTSAIQKMARRAFKNYITYLSKK